MGNVHVHVIGAVDEIWMCGGGRSYKIVRQQKVEGEILFYAFITIIRNINKWLSMRRKADAHRDTKDKKTRRAHTAAKFFSEQSVKDSCQLQNSF